MTLRLEILNPTPAAYTIIIFIGILRAIMKKKLTNHPIITGTLILSLTNITTRVIGFFYRVYLSRIFGAENMGVIQLTGPVSAMVFALSGAGMQTAISKCVSAISGTERKRRHRYLYYGLAFALTISVLCSYFVYTYADWLAVRFLSETRTAPLLRVLALSFPLSAAHACVNGYFLGKSQTSILAINQLIEQLVRVGVVYICCTSFLATGDVPDLTFTAWGVLIGEGAALFVTGISLIFGNRRHTAGLKLISHPANRDKSILAALLKMALPLNANRLAVNFLASIESIRIPLMLQVYGMTDSAALSTYGILTGMALPVLFFPGAFTGALSAMLLPAISEAHSKNDKERIKTITVNATFFVVFAGLLFGILFFMFSDFLGNVVFKEPLAGSYIRALCLLCPFMYVNGIFSSILQGLGRAMSIFYINVTGLLIRLAFVFFLIPRLGIKGYLAGLLVSQLYSCAMYLWQCYRRT